MFHRNTRWKHEVWTCNYFIISELHWIVDIFIMKRKMFVTWRDKNYSMWKPFTNMTCAMFATSFVPLRVYKSCAHISTWCCGIKGIYHIHRFRRKEAWMYYIWPRQMNAYQNYIPLLPNMFNTWDKWYDIIILLISYWYYSEDMLAPTLCNSYVLHVTRQLIHYSTGLTKQCRIDAGYFFTWRHDMAGTLAAHGPTVNDVRIQC